MIKNLLHLTILTMLWKRYRAVIVSTLLLFLYFWLVGQLHQDYVRYTELNDDYQFLALSFFIKWIAFGIGVIIYLLFNARFSLRVSHAQDATKIASRPIPQEEEKSSEKLDPFEPIRQRKKLRSKADFIIEKNRKS